MGKLLNPDNSAFQRDLEAAIHVDKSMLIDFANSVVCTEQKYLCVTRPRGFGKTIAAHMLAAYYSRGCDSRQLFSGLQIAKAESFGKHLNKYDTFFIDMTDYTAKYPDVDQIVSALERDMMNEIRDEYPKLKYPSRNSLFRTLDVVFIQTDIPFVFVIDNWDSIFHVHRNDRAGQKKYTSFLTCLLKDRSYVDLAYMTGILPIKKFGDFTSMNMFDEITMARPYYRIAEFTGFTVAEVEELCRKHGFSCEEMVKRYGGYNLGGVSISNPKAVVDAILSGSSLTSEESGVDLKPYLEMDLPELQEKVTKLIQGGRVKVNPHKFQNDLVTFRSADDVLTLLIHLGYLIYDRNTEEVWIPNRELEGAFCRLEEGKTEA